MRYAALACAAWLWAAGAFAAVPDRAPKPEEWGYRPADGASVSVNPPSLSWVREPDAAGYEVQWSRSAGFAGAQGAAARWSVYTHSATLEPGKWFWRYRIRQRDGGLSAWSRARTFTIPAGAPAFPRPVEAAQRIPKSHPRLFVTDAGLGQLRDWSRGGGQAAFAAVIREADRLLGASPTPEPEHMGTIRDPAMVKYWWSNRVQTIKACSEAEALAFAWMITRAEKYRDPARRWILHLASWNPDGPTNWTLNDEAAMPILHRLPRAYDWAYDTLSDDERARVRAAIRRRALDTWNAGQTGRGEGHLNTPYNSHGNRSWHKLAEAAIAVYHDVPEAADWIEFAIDKFYAAYPVWSDDAGGWHEGLSYWAGYMTKVPWWMDVARVALGIDGLKKPFFANFAEYALYTAPPGSPEMGFGDLSFRPPSSGWSFVRYFARRAENPYWTWWANQWKVEETSGEPVLAFLWGAVPEPAAKAPADLPPSKVFDGIGVAVLNSSLVSPDNVQVRFKSSPMGRQSHGHDAHNSFTLNAYGEALLVNNVYRDIYGSPFHKGWCWSTKAQNAMLVNGEGQKAHSPDPFGRIVRAELRDGFDYLAGDAAAAYEGKLKRYLRHVFYVKPELIVVLDDVEASAPSTFQFLLHGQAKFALGDGFLSLDRAAAGVRADYISADPLKLRQWDGYDPEPNWKYLDEVKGARIPNQWHVEAATQQPRTSAFVATVIRPYRKGAAVPGPRHMMKNGRLFIESGGVKLDIRQPGGTGPLARIQGGNGRYTVE